MNYATVNIIHNKSNYIEYYLREWFYGESRVSSNSAIIIQFENGDYIDVLEYKPSTELVAISKKQYIRLKNKFGERHLKFIKPFVQNGELRLNLTPLFKDYKRGQLPFTFEPSCFNQLYTDLISGKTIFGITRIKSSNHLPRFLIAFDPEILERDDIAHITKHIFMDESDIQQINQNKNNVISEKDVHISINEIT